MLVIVLAALAALNVVGVRGASRFNTAVTVAKLVPLVALVVFGSPRDRSLGEPRVARASRRPRRRPGVDAAHLRVSWRRERAGAERARFAIRSARFRARFSSRWPRSRCIYLAVQVVAQGVLGRIAGRTRNAAGRRRRCRDRPAGTDAGPRRHGGLDVRVRRRRDARRAAHALRLRARRISPRRARARARSRFSTPHVAIVAQSAIVIRARDHGHVRAVGDHRERGDARRVRRMLRRGARAAAA